MSDRSQRSHTPRLNELPDGDVAVAALHGSPDACELLVHRFERPVYNLVARIVHDAATAEDLTQESFLKMFRGLRQYDPSLRFSSWLFRIAHNTAIDHLRQRQVPLVTPLVGEDGEEQDPLQNLPDLAADSPETAMARHRLTAVLDAAIDTLRPEYRAVIVLRHQEDLDYDEIAEITGLPLGTVKTFLFRARRELAARLRESGLGPAETGPRGRP